MTFLWRFPMSNRIRGEYSSKLCPTLPHTPTTTINLNPVNQMSTGVGGGGQQQSIVMTQTVQNDQMQPVISSNKRSSQIISANNNNDGSSPLAAGTNTANMAGSTASPASKTSFLSSIFNIGNKSSMKFLSVSSSNKNKILSTRLFTSDSLC